MDNGYAIELQSVIAELYGGPLDDFVQRRDALAKELRSAGNRESATALKALRKPSRLAWALNLGALNGQKALAALEASVAGTLEAQAEGGDVRGAMATLRGAVRNLANESAEAAEREGHSVDVSALSNAVLAVLGRPESFAQLRSGRLVDVPEAGGLDFLANLPAPTRARQIAVSTPDSVPEDAHAEDTAAHENAQHAAKTLLSAQSRAQAAAQILREAASEVAAAEERFRKAEADLVAARNRHDSARGDAEAAASELRSAEAANTEAQRQVRSGSIEQQTGRMV